MTENQNPLVLDKNEEISEQKADDIRVHRAKTLRCGAFHSRLT